MGLIKLPDQSIKYFNENLAGIFDSGFLAEGPWNKKISEFIEQTIGAKRAIPTNSNGAGIVALLNIYRNYFNRDSVIIQTNTMYGVKTMVKSGGCELAGFVGCQLESLMPDLNDVKNTLGHYSKEQRRKLIILLSHIGGIVNPDIQAIANLCREENIILIEDCAHSYAATLNNKHSGLFGNGGVYSFYATKAIPAGEGGIVVTNDGELGELVANYGIYDRFNQKMDIGFNNRMSEIQALFTYSVVKEWKYIIADKRKTAENYIKVCSELGIPFIAQDRNGHSGNYYKFILYNHDLNIRQYLPELKTTTSSVYDYDIGADNPLKNHHICLPIWYGQEAEVTDQVISELYKSMR